MRTQMVRMFLLAYVQRTLSQHHIYACATVSMWWHFGIQIICSAVYIYQISTIVFHICDIYFILFCASHCRSDPCFQASINYFIICHPSIIPCSMMLWALSCQCDWCVCECVLFFRHILLCFAVCVHLLVFVCLFVIWVRASARSRELIQKQPQPQTHMRPQQMKRDTKSLQSRRKTKLEEKKKQISAHSLTHTHTLAHTRAKYTDITSHKYQAIVVSVCVHCV